MCTNMLLNINATALKIKKKRAGLDMYPYLGYLVHKSPTICSFKNIC